MTMFVMIEGEREGFVNRGILREIVCSDDFLRVGHYTEHKHFLMVIILNNVCNLLRIQLEPI